LIAAAISRNGYARDLIIAGFTTPETIHLFLPFYVLREVKRNLQA